MPRSIPCPACSAKLLLPDRLPDNVQKLRCPQCKRSMSVLKTTSPGGNAPSSIQPAPPVKAPAPHNSPARDDTGNLPAASADTFSDGLLPGVDDIHLTGEV